MKIGFIHSKYPGAEGRGAIHSATQIARALYRRGHDIDVFCGQSPPDDLRTEIPLLDISSSGFPYQSNLQYNGAIKQQVETFSRYDIVHSYSPRTLAGMEAVGRQTTAKTVVTLNAYGGVCPKNDLLYRDRESCRSNGVLKCTTCCTRTAGGHDKHGRVKRSLSRLGNLALIGQTSSGCQYVDAFQALSPQIKRAYEQFQFPENRLHVIPSIIDRKFVIDHESAFQDPIALLYVGHLEWQKGVDQLLPILERLQSRRDEAIRLTIVGSGGLESQIHEQVVRRGLQETVTLRGHLPNEELPEIYASHDVFLHPSRWSEPLGRVYLEALGAKTPIVTRDYGAIGEIIEGAGVTCDGSVESFVTTLDDIIDRGKLSEMSIAADSAVSKFEEKTVVSQLEQMYEKLLDSTADGAGNGETESIHN